MNAQITTAADLPQTIISGRPRRHSVMELNKCSVYSGFVRDGRVLTIAI